MNVQAAAQAAARRPAIPNWLIAGGLASLAVSTYYYTLYAVGTTDIDAEVQKVVESQKKGAK